MTEQQTKLYLMKNTDMPLGFSSGERWLAMLDRLLTQELTLMGNGPDYTRPGLHDTYSRNLMAAWEKAVAERNTP